jgi:hypothetical protein
MTFALALLTLAPIAWSPSIEIEDLDGKTVSVPAKGKPTALIFLGTECPHRRGLSQGAVLLRLCRQGDPARRGPQAPQGLRAERARHIGWQVPSGQAGEGDRHARNRCVRRYGQARVSGPDQRLLLGTQPPAGDAAAQRASRRFVRLGCGQAGEGRLPRGDRLPDPGFGKKGRGVGPEGPSDQRSTRPR